MMLAVGVERKFVVVTGVPGSGKTSLARRVGPLLGLRVIDKDDILESLFISESAGDGPRRRVLSRESDVLFQREAEGSGGAMLVSFWRLTGMSGDSGTPTGWLAALSKLIVNLQCDCPADVAARRFVERKRHPGHLDESRSFEEVRMNILRLSQLEPLRIGEIVSVDTSAEIDIEDVSNRISRAFERASGLNASLA